jgi:hypothetical protein
MTPIWKAPEVTGWDGDLRSMASLLPAGWRA